ncbi:MAG TPA: hypothetical protein VKQ36_04220 [Ktedonobacterales bacterium]|nr:hypothetical protein [Ktedonobacterales bacterium]
MGKVGDAEALEPIRPIEQDTVTLFGHPVRAVRLPDGRVAASFNDMTQALGLQRAAQVRRVRQDDTIGDQLLPTVLREANGSELPSEVLTAWAIPMWLTGIQVARLAPEKRPIILAFKVKQPTRSIATSLNERG